METKTGTGDTASNIFLTGSIFLANLDFTGLMDYAIKAVIGGFMWLLFKMVADHIERRRSQGPGSGGGPQSGGPSGSDGGEPENGQP